jgi:hypothetical protein
VFRVVLQTVQSFFPRDYLFADLARGRHHDVVVW